MKYDINTDKDARVLHAILKLNLTGGCVDAR